MKIASVIVLILLLGSAGLIFVTLPGQKFLLELEKGYAIEKLTYLPDGYEPIDQNSYINMGTGASQAGLIEVKSQNQSYFLIFRQMADNKDTNSLRDVEISTRYIKSVDAEFNGIKTKIYPFADGATYVWYKNNKRYEIMTNDLSITTYEVGRIDAGIVPVIIDGLKPAKDFIDSFRSTE